MATIITPTHTGFSVRGLMAPLSSSDLRDVALKTGALSVGHLDATKQSLHVVCPTDPQTLDAVIMATIELLRKRSLYTTRQNVWFFALEKGMTLIHFDDGLPHGTDFVGTSPNIGQVAYGDSNVVLAQAEGVTPDMWQAALTQVWARLMQRGAFGLGPDGSPHMPVPWHTHPTGQILMVDPGLAIIQTSGGLRYLATKGKPFHGGLPAELIGDKHFVIGAHNAWPTGYVPAAVRATLHIEVGRVSMGIASIGGLDAEAAIDYPFSF